MSVVTASLPKGVAGSPYVAMVTAAGGAPPYHWSIDSGLPPGLAIDATSGMIAGLPTTAGSFTFAARVEDSSAPARTASKSLTIVVMEMPTPDAGPVVFDAAPAVPDAAPATDAAPPDAPPPTDAAAPPDAPLLTADAAPRPDGAPADAGVIAATSQAGCSCQVGDHAAARVNLAGALLLGLILLARRRRRG